MICDASLRWNWLSWELNIWLKDYIWTQNMMILEIILFRLWENENEMWNLGMLRSWVVINKQNFFFFSSGGETRDVVRGSNRGTKPKAGMKNM